MSYSPTILGVRFFSGPAREAVAAGLRGGLVVVPSAPVLVGIADNAALRDAVLGADLAIADSGLMVLLWRLFERVRITRVSGLEYLKLMLERPELRAPGALLWVMPTAAARDRNLAWLQAQGFAVTPMDCYVAPRYPASGPLADESLFRLVAQRRPAQVILGLGGGVQERLGFDLRNRLAAEGRTPATYRPGIHCIGAAIGFLSGEQVEIPMWVDSLYLGWLWRCVSSPRHFVPRYWKAWRLVALVWRWRERPPVA